MKHENLSTFLHRLLFFLFVYTSVLYPGQMQKNGTQPEISEEEFLQWQQEIDREINNYVSALSPEEQQKFYQDVAELTNLMENMSEEELTSFVEDIFAQEMVDEPTPAPEEKMVTPKKEITPTTKPIVSIPKEDPNKIKQALTMLENLERETQRFLRVTQRIPELTGKIESWVKKEAIGNWKSDKSWQDVKKDIETFEQKITSLKTEDPETKQYRHIAHLIKNETLYNNLAKCSTDLSRHVPNITAPSFGLEVISKESRQAIKETLSSYVEALYILDVIKGIDTVIAQYEPRAKQLKEQEEVQKKRALEESKKGRKASPKRMSRASQSTGGGYTPFSDFDYDLSDDTFPEYRYSPSAYDSGTQSKDRSATRTRDTGALQPGAPGVSSGPAAIQQKKSQKDTPDTPAVSKEKPLSEEIKKIDSFIDTAIDQIDELLEKYVPMTIEEYIKTARAQQALKPTDTKKLNPADADDIKQVASTIRSARRRMKKLHNDHEKATAKKRIKNSLKQDKNLLKLEKEMKVVDDADATSEIMKALKELSLALSSLPV